MMKKSKLLALIIALCLIGGIITACGSDKPADNPSGNDDGQTTAGYDDDHGNDYDDDGDDGDDEDYGNETIYFSDEEEAAAQNALIESFYVEAGGKKLNLPCTLQELLDLGYSAYEYQEEDITEKLNFGADDTLMIDLFYGNTYLKVWFANPSDEEISVYDAVTSKIGIDWTRDSRDSYANGSEYYVPVCGITSLNSFADLREKYRAAILSDVYDDDDYFAIYISERSINGYFVYFNSVRIDKAPDGDFVDELEVSFRFKPW